jgi:hypothetical protein
MFWRKGKDIIVIAVSTMIFALVVIPFNHSSLKSAVNLCMVLVILKARLPCGGFSSRLSQGDLQKKELIHRISICSPVTM